MQAYRSISAAAMTAALAAMTGTCPVSAAEPLPPSPRELAAHWSPVIVHDLTEGKHRLQYMTRFDYDGDWQGTNNTANAEGFDLPAAAYYWVVETTTHAFVGYGLFHVAGVQDGRQYENDMVGVVVVVERSFAESHPAGRFVALVTVAQANLGVAAERDGEVADAKAGPLWRARVTPSLTVRGAESTTLDDVDFVVDAWGLHPVVYAGADGAALETTTGLDGRPTTFEDLDLVDWRGRDWDEKAYPDGQRGRGGFVSLAVDGVVYHFQDQAQVTVEAKVKGRGRYPHHWEVVGYDLLALDELWQRREDYRSGKRTFEDDGVFAGGGPRGPGARAPWGWTGPASLLFSAPGELLATQIAGVEGLDQAVQRRAVK